MYNGYKFYFSLVSSAVKPPLPVLSVMEFPVTPSELTITIGSRNETVDLIDGGEINILKSPSLTEVEFTARFPNQRYPFSNSDLGFDTYWTLLKNFKENKKSFRFIVIRYAPDGKRKLWGTNMLVSLEDMTLKESADEGNDVLVDFKLKQYKKYGVKILKVVEKPKPTPAEPKRETVTKDEEKEKAQTYTVKKGDCLWKISKKFYGKGSQWKTIYNANKTAIENDAKKHGKKSSSNGHWIWPGLKLTIPAKKK